MNVNISIDETTRQELGKDGPVSLQVRDLAYQGRYTYFSKNGEKVKVGSSLTPHKRGATFGTIIAIAEGDGLEKWVHGSGLVEHTEAPEGLSVGRTEWVPLCALDGIFEKCKQLGTRVMTLEEFLPDDYTVPTARSTTKSTKKGWPLRSFVMPPYLDSLLVMEATRRGVSVSALLLDIVKKTVGGPDAQT